MQVMPTHFIEIRPSPFGQAYIRFNGALDRDALFFESPHQFDDIYVVFQSIIKV